VVVNTLTTAFVAPISSTITSFPRTVLDLANGEIAQAGDNAVGISQFAKSTVQDPTQAAHVFGTSTSLNQCNDSTCCRTPTRRSGGRATRLCAHQFRQQQRRLAVTGVSLRQRPGRQRRPLPQLGLDPLQGALQRHAAGQLQPGHMTDVPHTLRLGT
jgi:hypothetical protein